MTAKRRSCGRGTASANEEWDSERGQAMRTYPNAYPTSAACVRARGRLQEGTHTPCSVHRRAAGARQPARARTSAARLATAKSRSIMSPPSTGSSCRSRFSARYLRGASSFMSSLDPDLLTSARRTRRRALRRERERDRAPAAQQEGRRSVHAVSPSRSDDCGRELRVAAPRHEHAAQLVERVEAQTRRLAHVLCHAQQQRHASLHRRGSVRGIGPALHPGARPLCEACAAS